MVADDHSRHDVSVGGFLGDQAWRLDERRASSLSVGRRGTAYAESDPGIDPTTTGDQQRTQTATSMIQTACTRP